jgi:Lysylphosphatidylglycerol synthase TM region
MRRATRRVLPLLLTAVFFYVVLRRIPYQRLLAALGEADYFRFLALMILNTVIYVAWDTFVLAVAVRWFHGPVRYRDLLPVRAASYIVSVLNTNAGRGALTVFVGRLLHRPSLQIGSTVIFLVLTEYTHLVAWATLGIVGFGSELTRPLLWVPPAVAGFWLLFFAYARGGRSYESEPPAPTVPMQISRRLTAPWRGALLRTFRLAPARRYVEIVLLRAPMFFVSLCLYYFAAPAFGFSIPFGHMLTFLPVVFMVAALPITVARLGTTQAAWLLLFGGFAPAERLLAFSLATALTFALTRAVIGVVLLPLAYRDLVEPPRAPEPERHAAAVA